MKVLQIVPRDGRRFYDSVVRKQDDIHRNGRGTFSRKGPKRRNAAHWVHAKFTGSVGSGAIGKPRDRQDQVAQQGR